MSQQVEHANEDHSDELGFERLVFFSDAVLAIAITLMALEIRLPELEPERAADQISVAFQALLPHIGVYILSFLVIGIYWTVHHRLFRQIRRYNSRLMWFNLFFLMMAAFLPVATNALGTYSSLPLVTAFYAVSVALVGLSEFALWLYAVRSGFMVQPAAKHSRLYFGIRILVPPLTFLLSILLIPVSVDWAQASWALMIPILFGLRFIFPREHAERALFEQGELP